MGAALPAPEDRPPPSADRVPTLTEVVEMLAPEPVAPAPAPPAETLPASPDDTSAIEAPVFVEDGEQALLPTLALPQPAAVAEPPHVPDAEELVALVMAELQPRVDWMLEARLREVLAPALARAADGLIRDAGQEVSATLRDLVHEAVARALRQGADG